MANERIKLEMTTEHALLALCGGNSGALTACMEIFACAKDVDPDAVFGPWAPLLVLDALNIWEDRIYMLWNDVCGRDVATMIAVLRAVQLGFVYESALNHAIDNRGYGLDVDDLVSKVKCRLPRFNVSTPGEAKKQ